MGLHGRFAPQKIVFYFDGARNMEKSFWIRPFKVPALTASVMCFPPSMICQPCKALILTKSDDILLSSLQKRRRMSGHHGRHVR